VSDFKHHSYFVKEKHVQSYLFPHVCFQCRKSFKKPQSQEPGICSQCGSQLTALSRKFAAPKTSNVAQWNKVRFLVEHGFLFQSVYEFQEDGGKYRVGYPQTIEEAEEFVDKYQEQRSTNAF
jgi:DNA-directed RNA polymerase subunit RPC12/RpoP